MRLSLILLSVLASLCIAQQDPNIEGIPLKKTRPTNETAQVDLQIIGGLTASPGQFPYQISLRINRSNTHICGGTIISNRHVVTAAQCIAGKYLDDLTIVAGSTRLSSGGEVYNLVGARHHVAFDPTRHWNDIALLYTDRIIRFSSTVNSIPLLLTPAPIGTTHLITGWGLTTYPGRPSDVLQYAHLATISLEACASTWGAGMLTGSQLCTSKRSGSGGGVFLGDGGGGLVVYGALAGIISAARPCAVEYPDVFTSVPSFIDWIQYNMRNTSNKVSE